MNTVTEEELAAKAVAPRITPADIEANIASTWYMNVGDAMPANDFQPPVPATHPLRLLTLCVLVLRNGFTVVGKSACASPENFDQEMGGKIAREDAIRQCWPLMGYALRDRLTLSVREAIPGTPRLEFGTLDGQYVMREGVTGGAMGEWQKPHSGV